MQLLLARRTGLRLTDADVVKLEQLLRVRAGHGDPVAYVTSLSEAGLAREAEFLAARLTPAETYFFRDQGQFALLRTRILPELIERRREKRRLRLWSAGCASGEEAYSIAMLIDIVLPEWQTWQITVVGSDINDEALTRARRGRYGDWSFRMVPENLKARYFRCDGDAWVLDPRIRAMVDFRSGNLVMDALADWMSNDMDLILCRNVLIYFYPEAVRIVAEKLAASLAEGGYLVTGHTELHACPLHGLQAHLFPEGVVYERSMRALPAAPQSLVSSTPCIIPLPPAGGLPPPDAAPPVRESALERAQALANRGDYEAADHACHEALNADFLQPGPHFLLAQLAQLRGDYREAEAQLNQTLYLAPDHIAAHLELAALLERAGQTERARARRGTVRDLLRRLPADAMVEPFEVSAGQLADRLIEFEPPS
ncbi:CheR family methyltransferase [Ideonella sp. YS5]|uniref:CheR family methyltransferase n=1 Tax=Ideonella sp. YS5 TaxID=3453714 RepID=UPI003EED7212